MDNIILPQKQYYYIINLGDTEPLKNIALNIKAYYYDDDVPRQVLYEGEVEELTLPKTSIINVPEQFRQYIGSQYTLYISKPKLKWDPDFFWLFYSLKQQRFISFPKPKCPIGCYLTFWKCYKVLGIDYQYKNYVDRCKTASITAISPRGYRVKHYIMGYGHYLFFIYYYNSWESIRNVLKGYHLYLYPDRFYAEQIPKEQLPDVSILYNIALAIKYQRWQKEGEKTVSEQIIINALKDELGQERANIAAFMFKELMKRGKEVKK